METGMCQLAEDVDVFQCIVNIGAILPGANESVRYQRAIVLQGGLRLVFHMEREHQRYLRMLR
jgi:hypothetical protein